jgi:hypothetical protein
MVGVYLLLAQMLETVDFPVKVPIWDLSQFIKGASERAKARVEGSKEVV